MSWGYCEVFPQGVIVLAEVAESLAEIDRARAEANLKKAESALLDPLLEADQMEMMHRKIQRNQARIAALTDFNGLEALVSSIIAGRRISCGVVSSSAIHSPLSGEWEFMLRRT